MLYRFWAIWPQSWPNWPTWDFGSHFGQHFARFEHGFYFQKYSPWWALSAQPIMGGWGGCCHGQTTRQHRRVTCRVAPCEQQDATKKTWPTNATDAHAHLRHTFRCPEFRQLWISAFKEMMGKEALIWPLALPSEKQRCRVDVYNQESRKQNQHYHKQTMDNALATNNFWWTTLPLSGGNRWNFYKPRVLNRIGCRPWQCDDVQVHARQKEKPFLELWNCCHENQLVRFTFQTIVAILGWNWGGGNATKQDQFPENSCFSFEAT